MLAPKASRIKRFVKNESGVIAIQFGLISSVLFAMAGAAIDFTRWHSASRTTREALDAAVLAGARTMQITQNQQAALDAAQSMFQLNAVNKVDFSINTISFVFVDNNTALTAQGTAKINTLLLRLVGFDELTLASDAGSGYPKGSIMSGGSGGSNIEISLMLDVTGSMCDDGSGPCTTGTKMSGLKEAAKRLVDTVIGQDQSGYYSKMAIVPFSTRVRLAPDGQGGGIMKAVTDLNPLWGGWIPDCNNWVYLGGGGGGSSSSEGNGGGGNWECTEPVSTQVSNWKIMPCVTDRFYNANWSYDYTDYRPGSGEWINAHGGDRLLKSADSSNTAVTSGLGITSSDPASQWNYSPDGACYDITNANVLMPLSSDKTALKSRIDALEGFGSTAGALGTAWTWYTLSPKWGNVFTGSSRPGEYSDLTTIQQNGRPTLRKVAILMTDGVYNTFRGWKEQSQQEVSDYAKQLCTNMKAEGIEIFTVGLALDELPAGERAIAEDTLRSCGTDVSHFYSSLNVEELQTAFQQIGFQLSTVRLTR